MGVKKKTITVFDGRLSFDITLDDWEYLCKKRFYTYNPDPESIEAEFVTGTGITSSKLNLWVEAADRFSEYVADLREIKSLDINKMCRELLEQHSG